MNRPDPRSTPRLIGADVTEVTLPSIGQRYDVSVAEGGALIVVIHHSGRRDLYVMDPQGDERQAAVTLTDS